MAGRDLGWFFDQVYRSSNVFDYGIQELRSTARATASAPTVVARRYGEATFPIDVRVTFADGEQVIEHWDGRDRWQLYTYDRPRRRGDGRSRSRARAAARRQRDEQLEERSGRKGAGDGRDEVVAEVDGLAAGLPALVERVRMSPLRRLARRHPPGRRRAARSSSASG